MTKYYLSSFLVLFVFQLVAQKKALELEDFDQWKSIERTRISKDGALIYWETNPQEGDGTLHLYNTTSKEEVVFERGSNARLSFDKAFFVFTVEPPFEETREAKRKEKKKDEMPKKHLVVYQLNNQNLDTVKNIESYKMPEEEGRFVAVTLKVEEPEEPKDSTEAKEENDLYADAAKKGKKKKKAKKKEVVRLFNLGGDVSVDLEKIDETYFADFGGYFFFVREEGDSLNPKGLFAIDLPDTNSMLIDSSFEAISKINLNKQGTLLSYITTQDSAEAEVKKYSVHLWNGEESKILLDSATQGLPDGWVPSENYTPMIDENGKYLLVGTKPAPIIYEKDTMALDEEKVKLDIWSHTDDYIQPYQLKNRKRFETKSYLARIDLNDGGFLQIEDEYFEVGSVPRDTLGTWLPASDDHAYRKEMAWMLPTRQDMYVVNLETGERKLVAKENRASLSLSPNEDFAIWYDRAERHYFAYDIATGETRNLSENIKHPVWDEEHDTPDDPYPYGTGGWLNDSVLIIQDQFDLFAVDVTNPAKPVNLTQGQGRKNNVTYDVERMGVYNKRLPSDNLVLSAFNNQTKDEGFSKLNLNTKEVIVLIEPEPFLYYQIDKAEEAETVLVRKASFTQYPELAVTDVNFTNPEVITNANPQQEEYNWGTVELVEWKGYNKKQLQGLLYKPEDFDPNKKYPLMVYFYETYSDRLHNYVSPRPSASTVNFAHYVSNGYVVFVPDIVYETGKPGQGAYDCIISGTKKLAKESWIDETKMAIQGQSWGGYQVAWLVTQTDMFAAAMAGAPVSNMTSAYGGIRWGSGLSREFQYERTQSRLGATLWEDRDVYINNSPVFFADKVNTPLLMMHNDEDGAVPWYQGIEYFMALRRLGQPVWMLVYNGEAHNLRKRHNRKDLTVRMMQFFDYYLKDAPVPEWMVEGRDAVEKDDNPALELMED